MMVIKQNENAQAIVEDLYPENDSRAGSLKKFCKMIFQYVFSQIGLCIVVLLYAVLGGFLFRHLEKTNEEHECLRVNSEYNRTENTTLENVLAIVQGFHSGNDVTADGEDLAPSSSKEMKDEIKKQLVEFRESIMYLGQNVLDCSTLEQKGVWTFSGAMLLSVTIFTTIGYGNIAPKTFWGQLVCICYSMLGIPLMFVCLANLSAALGDLFRLGYSQLFCCGFCLRGKLAKQRSKQQRLKEHTHSTPITLQGSADFKSSGNKDTLKSQPEADNETNNGLGEFGNPETNHEKLSNPDAPIQGKDSTAVYSESKDKHFVMVSSKDVVNEMDDLSVDFDEHISIPLTISLGVIAIYLFIGAFLFRAWEDWELLSSAYFCFVTISTIGFGDLVPGSTDVGKDGDFWRTIGSAFYMLLGMALLSMSFNLIQDEIAAKFKSIGQKLGLLDEA